RREEGVRTDGFGASPPARGGGPRGDGQTHGPLFLGPENLVVPRAARARGAPRDRRAASAGGLRGRERGDEGEGIREGARAGTTHGGRVHIAHPREAPAHVERSGRDPNVRGGRRPRGIDRGPREGPRASRGGRDRAGRRPRDAAQGATGDAAAAGRGGRGRPPEAPGRPRGRGGDEHPAAADERPSERLFEKARELFRAKKYRQAIATALQSEAEAERVGLQQQIAKQAVESVEGKLRDLGKGSSIVMDLVSDSRKAFAVGDYVKALDTAIHASDSIADLRVLLDEVAEVREKAKALLQTALEVGADASKFEKAFQDGESAFELGEVERARAAFAGSIEWGHSLLASYLRDQLTKAEGLLEMCRKMDV